MDKVSVKASESPSTIDIVIISNKENQSAISYFEQQQSIDSLKKQLSDMTERNININVRKISQKEALDTRLKEWDLSKIKFNVDYKY